MRAWLIIIAVLATFEPIVQVASTEDTTISPPSSTTESLSSSSSSSTTTSTSTTTERTKIDPESRIVIEQNLLSLLGRKSPPKDIDRSKVIIPQQLRDLYVTMTGQEQRKSVNLPKPGLLTKSANTVRSFFHEGKSNDFPSIFFFISVFGDFNLWLFRQSFFRIQHVRIHFCQSN